MTSSKMCERLHQHEHSEPIVEGFVDQINCSAFLQREVIGSHAVNERIRRQKLTEQITPKHQFPHLSHTFTKADHSQSHDESGQIKPLHVVSRMAVTTCELGRLCSEPVNWSTYAQYDCRLRVRRASKSLYIRARIPH